MPDRVAAQPASVAKALAAFRRKGGLLRMSEAVKAGVHRRTLYAMLDEGQIERLSRGLYRLTDAPPLGEPDLVTVTAKIPQGVICLVSALAFHDLTTQIPHAVYVAVPRNSKPPRLDHPPLRVFRFDPRAYKEGVESHTIDGVTVRVFSAEKTLADCFKYRNKIGLDTAVEALRRYAESRKVDRAALLRAAEACRVDKVMRPYLEAVL